MLRAVELAGDETTIPGQDGLWFRNTRHLGQILSPQPLPNLRESGALRVGEAYFAGHVRTEDSILRDQVFALEEQALIDQPCHVRQQPRPGVVLHAESIW